MPSAIQTLRKNLWGTPAVIVSYFGAYNSSAVAGDLLHLLPRQNLFYIIEDRKWTGITVHTALR